MRITNFGSFGNMHIRNGLFGYPKRRAAGFPWFSLIIVLAMLGSWLRSPPTQAEKDQDYQQQLELWRAHPEFVAHPTRSK